MRRGSQKEPTRLYSAYPGHCPRARAGGRGVRGALLKGRGKAGFIGRDNRSSPFSLKKGFQDTQETQGQAGLRDNQGRQDSQHRTICGRFLAFRGPAPSGPCKVREIDRFPFQLLNCPEQSKRKRLPNKHVAQKKARKRKKKERKTRRISGCRKLVQHRLKMNNPVLRPAENRDSRQKEND